MESNEIVVQEVSPAPRCSTPHSPIRRTHVYGRETGIITGYNQEIPPCISCAYVEGIAPSNTRDSVRRASLQTTHRERFLIKETTLVMLFCISFIAIIASFVLIGIYPQCEITSICSSIISAIIGAWVGLLVPVRSRTDKG